MDNGVTKSLIPLMINKQYENYEEEEKRGNQPTPLPPHTIWLVLKFGLVAYFTSIEKECFSESFKLGQLSNSPE